MKSAGKGFRGSTEMEMEMEIAAVVVTCLKTSYLAPLLTAFSVLSSHLHMKLSPVIMVSSGPE